MTTRVLSALFKRFLFVAIFVFGSFFAFAGQVRAETQCSNISVAINSTKPDGSSFFVNDTANNSFELTASGLAGGSYQLIFAKDRGFAGPGNLDANIASSAILPASNGSVTFPISSASYFSTGGTIFIYLNKVNGNSSEWNCLGYTYTVLDQPYIKSGTFKISQMRDGKQCFGGQGSSGGCMEAGTVVKVEGIVMTGAKPLPDTQVHAGVTEGSSTLAEERATTNSDGYFSVNFTLTKPGVFDFIVEIRTWTFPQNLAHSKGIAISPACQENSCSTVNNLQTTDPTETVMQQRVFQLCTQITNTELKGKCDECYGKEGVWTAVGCIQRTPQSIVKSFLEIGLGVGGAITLLMCLAAGFTLTTSQGDPTKVNEARDMITSAVIGLLFIIFSVFILQFIGVTIFNIPAFGAPTTP